MSTVLIVHDDPSGFHALKAILEPSGSRVAGARTPAEARRRAAGGEVAVVVVDARSPGIDGREVLTSLRTPARPAATTPVVLVAAPGGAESDVASALDLGATEVVVAPVVPRALRAKVDLLRERATLSWELARQGQELDRSRRLLEQRSAALRGLHAAIRLVAGRERVDVMMAGLARTLAEGLGWEVGAYWTVADTGIRCVEAWYDPAFSAPARERLHRGSARGDGLVGRAWESGAPEWAPLSRLGPDDACARAALDTGLRGVIAVPVTVESGCLGVLELLRTSSQPPDAQTVATLTAISVFAGQFVQIRRTLEEAERLKNEFFALVSHELLTPLTSIIGYLEDLLSGEAGEFNAEQEHDLGVVDRNARRLHRLVDDLMFVAQVEAGHLSLDWASVDLAAVTADAVEAARPSAAGRGVELVLGAAPVARVRGDAARLAQVVDNLISNAVKFSPEGGRVDVVVRARGHEAVVAVTDVGLGIPAPEVGQVFERFFRSSTAMAREIPGIGLGLPISKAIVEAHGGRIAVESVEGEGSTFSVSVPREAPATGDRGADRG